MRRRADLAQGSIERSTGGRELKPGGVEVEPARGAVAGFPVRLDDAPAG